MTKACVNEWNCPSSASGCVVRVVTHCKHCFRSARSRDVGNGSVRIPRRCIYDLFPCLLRFLLCFPWFAHRYEPRNTQKNGKTRKELTIFQTEPLPRCL